MVWLIEREQARGHGDARSSDLSCHGDHSTPAAASVAVAVEASSRCEG